MLDPQKQTFGKNWSRFLQVKCHCCHQTNSVRHPRETQTTDSNQQLTYLTLSRFIHQLTPEETDAASFIMTWPHYTHSERFRKISILLTRKLKSMFRSFPNACIHNVLMFSAIFSTIYYWWSKLMWLHRNFQNSFSDKFRRKLLRTHNRNFYLTFTMLLCCEIWNSKYKGCTTNDFISSSNVNELHFSKWA